MRTISHGPVATLKGQGMTMDFALANSALLKGLNFHRMTETLIVILSVPFALVGGVWRMWARGYNLSVAVALGFIVLAGVAVLAGTVLTLAVIRAIYALVKQWCLP